MTFAEEANEKGVGRALGHWLGNVTGLGVDAETGKGSGPLASAADYVSEVAPYKNEDGSLHYSRFDNLLSFLHIGGHEASRVDQRLHAPGKWGE